MIFIPKSSKILCFLFAIFICNIYARVLFIPNYQLERCPEFKGNEANVVDTTELDTHVENDTHVFWIGRVVFNTSFEVLPFQFYTEKYERGQWFKQIYDRKFDDMCTFAHDKTQLNYPDLDSFPECPIKPGTAWTLDMIQIALPEYLLEAMPPHYCGKWRGTVIGEFIIDGVKKYECRRAYGDVFDDGKSRVLGKIGG